MKKIGSFLNPFARLGQKKYSLAFPLIFMISYTVGYEYFALNIARDPRDVSLLIIIGNIALMIYFAFRDGIKGGLTIAIITILHYFYIVLSRQNDPQQFTRSIETTIILGIVYIALVSIIGWLRQTLDNVIGQEKEARRLAEDDKRRLQTIIEQLPVGVIITDEKGKIVKANSRLEQITGVKNQIGLVAGRDMAITSTHNGQPTKPSDSPLARALAKGKTIANQEFSIIHKSGKTTHVQVNASVVRNKYRKIIAAVSLVTDITQQKELEGRKDDFVNMASHELKTPLTSAKLFIRTLKSLLNERGGKQEQLITKVDKQIDKLLILVKELLDVTNINQGKLRLNTEKFAINDAINEVVNDLQATTIHKLLIKDMVNKQVSGDREKIMQVITNLITNAIKYSDPKKEIIISSKNSKGNITISVEDFGIGISETQQKSIFNRFYQANDNSEHNTYPGLGLGLFIASQIAQLHNGKLWVKSKEGKGSKFYFSLPLSLNNV